MNSVVHSLIRPAKFLALVVSVGFGLDFFLNSSFATNQVVDAPNNPYEVAKALIGVTGTFLGILLTSVSILAAVLNRPIIQAASATGHYRVFVQDAFVCCFILLVALVANIVALFIATDAAVKAMKVGVFFSALSLPALLYVGHKFYKFILHL